MIYSLEAKLKILRNILVGLVLFWIVSPIFLNAYNMFVNREDIVLFKKWYSRTSQMRPKNLFFIDGKFEGIKADLESDSSKAIFCEKTLECGYNPKNTLFRVKLLKEVGEDNYTVLGNVSFGGELKDEILDKSVTDYIIENSFNLFAENVSTKESFDKLINKGER